MLLRFALLSLLCVWSLPGQSVMGGGYTEPAPVRVAPGQIVTFYLNGLHATLTETERAAALPLPTELAGISATLKQAFPPKQLAVPLVSISQRPLCSPVNPGGSECVLTAVTVQIPFEMTAHNRLVETLVAEGPYDMLFYEKGVYSGAIQLDAEVDNVHVVEDCSQTGSLSYGGRTCSSAVTHADGAWVTAHSPARPGETVTVYALGLGHTDPDAKTGAAPPTPLPLAAPVALDFEYLPNAAPLRPQTTPGVTPVGTAPDFVALVPGYAGLYQLNLRVPAPPSQTAACGSGVDSNLTVRIEALTSYDGARLCVQIGQ